MLPGSATTFRPATTGRRSATTVRLRRFCT